jgi:hypothetical protein
VSNVVRLKTPAQTRIEAADEEVGRVLVALGERYGPFLITTVFMRYMAECIACAVRRGGAPEKAWIKDIARTFHRATKGHNNTTPGTKT